MNSSKLARWLAASVVGVGLAVAGPVSAASATSGVWNCGTHGWYQAGSALNAAYTAQNPGSTCGTYQVRAYYTVTTSGSQYWSDWVYSSTNANFSTSYGITRSEHMTTYSGVLGLTP
jgi:hypothetical protein